MKPKETFTGELHQYWKNPPKKPPVFLPAESSEWDVQEITLYLEAIIETALENRKINPEQRLICEANREIIAGILEGKKAVPHLKRGMHEISPAQLLQSLLFLSEKEIQDTRERSLSGAPYFEAGSANKKNVICFLYSQLEGDASYTDRFINHRMPVNGDTVYCTYDNYLPIYKLMEKYTPGAAIRLVNSREQAEGKYIYVVTFKYFPDFFANSRNNLLAVVPGYILEDCRNGKALIVYNDLDGATGYRAIMPCLEEQLRKAGIAASFYLLSGDWANASLQSPATALQKIYAFLRPSSKQINFYIINYFEEAMACSTKLYHPGSTYQTKLDLIPGNAGFLRHFICLNRTVKDYRLYISWFFYTNNLLDKCYISQDRYSGEQDFKFGYHKNSALWDKIETGKFEKFKLSLPWRLEEEEGAISQWDSVPLNAVNNSFCWVVTETSFSDLLPADSFRLTEKTYKPIAFFMPFILIGNPFTLAELRKSGYQTFSQWWDESYDSIIDPIRRMEKITELILHISRLSQGQLITMYQEMKPVLIHNHNLLLNSQSGKPAMEAIFSDYVAL